MPPRFTGGDSVNGLSSGLQAAVTPSDSTMLPFATRGLYVGTGGNVAVHTMNATTVVFTAVPAGTVLPITVARVNSTNTTASNIVALF